VQFFGRCVWTRLPRGGVYASSHCPGCMSGSVFLTWDRWGLCRACLHRTVSRAARRRRLAQDLCAPQRLGNGCNGTRDRSGHDAAHFGLDDELGDLLHALGERIDAHTFSPDQIRAAAKTVPVSTSSVDGVRPRQLAHIPDRALDLLSEFFTDFEVWGWPDDEQLVVVTLIPKKASGLRPIALFRTAYRVFAKLHMWTFLQWIYTQPRHGVNVTSGRHTLDATWRSRARDLSQRSGYAIEIQMDLKKAFEQVCRKRLVEVAIAEGCPLGPLLLSLAASRWPRRLVYGKRASSPFCPTRGIAAGSSLATFELEVYHTDAIRRVTAILPRPVVSVRVDDVSTCVAGKSLRAALRNFTHALATCHYEFVSELNSQFAADKTQLIVSHNQLGPLVLQRLRKHVGTLAFTANRLVADHSLQRTARRTGKLQLVKRIKAHAARFRRVTRFSKGRSSPYLYQVGVKPVTTYGWGLGTPSHSQPLAPCESVNPHTWAPAHWAPVHSVPCPPRCPAWPNLAWAPSITPIDRQMPSRILSLLLTGDAVMPKARLGLTVAALYSQASPHSERSSMRSRFSSGAGERRASSSAKTGMNLTSRLVTRFS
jgi:hypothetical protein